MNQEHYTQEEAVELARECGFDIGSGITERVHVCTTGKVHDLINTAVTRKLAEKVKEQESKIAVSLADATAAMLEFKNKWIDATAKLAAAEERVKELEDGVLFPKTLPQGHNALRGVIVDYFSRATNGECFLFDEFYDALKAAAIEAEKVRTE